MAILLKEREKHLRILAGVPGGVDVDLSLVRLRQAKTPAEGKHRLFRPDQRPRRGFSRKMTGWVQIGSKFALRSTTPCVKRLKPLVWKGGRVV